MHLYNIYIALFNSLQLPDERLNEQYEQQRREAITLEYI